MISYVIKHIPSDQYVYNDISDTAGMIIFTNTTLLAQKYSSLDEAEARIKSSAFKIQEISR